MTLRRDRLTALLGLAATLLALSAACDKPAQDQAASATEAKPADAKPTQDPAAQDKPAQDKPAQDEPQVTKLVFAFQPQENPEALSPNANQLAAFLQERIGLPCEVFLPTSYAAVVEALRGQNADVAYFSGWPYLMAHRMADVELLVAETRAGQPFYYSQWYVLADSAIQTTADLKGKHIAFTSPTSTSGYLFPLAKVIQDGHLKTGEDPKSFFGEVLFAGGYEQALKALVHGKVEAAAASDYAFARYLSPEEQAKLRVLVKQGPVPTHGIGVRKALPEPLKAKIKAAFLELNKDEHKALLKSVYGAEQLVERSHDEHVQALDAAQKAVGADFALEKKK